VRKVFFVKIINSTQGSSFFLGEKYAFFLQIIGVFMDRYQFEYEKK